VEIDRTLEKRNTSKRWLAIAIGTTVLVALLPLVLPTGKDGEQALPPPEVRLQVDPLTPSRASTLLKQTNIPVEQHPPSSAPTDELATNTDSSDVVQRLNEMKSIASQVQVSTLLQRNADEAVKTVESYCERARQLRERSPFEPHRQIKEGGEAAYFLAPLIDWFTAQARMPDWAPQRIGLLHLPETVTARINAAGQNWPTTLSHADVGQLDFGWMRQTLAYTYWSLAAAGPLAELDGEPDLGVLAPDYRFFLNWAKLRYVEALWRGDLDEATIEVQHLAMLIHTNEGAIPDNLAVQVLGLVVPALKVAAQRGILPSGLVPPDPTVLAQFRDLSRASESYFWPGVPADVMKRALSCAPSPCAALLEGAYMRNSVGQLSPEQTDADLWAIYESSNCDEAMMQVIKRAPPKNNFQALAMLRPGAPLPLERLFGLTPLP